MYLIECLNRMSNFSKLLVIIQRFCWYLWRRMIMNYGSFCVQLAVFDSFAALSWMNLINYYEFIWCKCLNFLEKYACDICMSLFVIYSPIILQMKKSISSWVNVIVDKKYMKHFKLKSLSITRQICICFESLSDFV